MCVHLAVGGSRGRPHAALSTCPGMHLHKPPPPPTACVPATSRRAAAASDAAPRMRPDAGARIAREIWQRPR